MQHDYTYFLVMKQPGSHYFIFTHSNEDPPKKRKHFCTGLNYFQRIQMYLVYTSVLARF